MTGRSPRSARPFIGGVRNRARAGGARPRRAWTKGVFRRKPSPPEASLPTDRPPHQPSRYELPGESGRRRLSPLSSLPAAVARGEGPFSLESGTPQATNFSSDRVSRSAGRSVRGETRSKWHAGCHLSLRGGASSATPKRRLSKVALAPPRLREKWHSLRHQFFPRPRFAERTAVWGGRDEDEVALDVHPGTKKWHRDRHLGIVPAAVAGGGPPLSEKWHSPRNQFFPRPRFAERRAVWGTGDGVKVALDLHPGTRKWRKTCHFFEEGAFSRGGEGYKREAGAPGSLIRFLPFAQSGSREED